MKHAIGVAILLLSTTVLSAQDLTMTTKTTVGAAGSSFKSLATTYMTTNTSRTNDKGHDIDIVIDYQKGITYSINHKARTITFTKSSDLPGLAAYMKEHAPKGMEAFSARMNDMYGDPAIFKVENIGKETVIGRSCNKVRITVGNQIWEFSVDPSLKSPVDAASMARLAEGRYSALAPYPRAAKVMANMATAMANLKGVILKMHEPGLMDMEVTSISQGSIPASTFVLPAGYAMKDQIAETEKRMAARPQH
jgi:hypothetical protein